MSSIRQWLIALIREAVRSEMQASSRQFITAPLIPMRLHDLQEPSINGNLGSTVKMPKFAVSFEQMQEEAIKAQEEESDERRVAAR